MTKRELVELNAILIKIANLGKTKFKYAVLKNIEAIKSSASVLLDLENDIKKLVSAYESDRNNVILRIGKKNEDGSIFIDVADKDMVEEFNEELKKLQETHAESIATYNEKMQEFWEILDETVEEEFKFKPLLIDQLPEEDISFKQLEVLEKFGLIQENINN